MKRNLKVLYEPTERLKPYKHNAKVHTEKQIAQIVKSIREFGFNDPIAVDETYTVIEGHGRLLAAQKMGLETVPVIILDGLTDQQRKAYVLAHNSLTMSTGFDLDVLSDELERITAFDMDEFGLDLSWLDQYDGADFFNRENRNDKSTEGQSDEYREFVEKFNADAPKTTDDCYTPDNIYNVVCEYVENRFRVNRKDFVRPFYPGGDYEKYRYKEGAVVVDNPPFSILAQIIRFYTERGIPFFLFAPALTIINTTTKPKTGVIVSDAKILYENGATVPTAFVSNMMGDILLDNDPELTRAIATVNEENQQTWGKTTKTFDVYDYPPDVITSGALKLLSRYGQRLTIKRSEAHLVNALDAQRKQGKAIYGYGCIVSKEAAERAKEAAERAKEAAERERKEKAIVWTLSDRERKIQAMLGATKATEAGEENGTT